MAELRGRAPVSAGRKGLLFILALLGLSTFVGFVSLGNWQLERRSWKLDLIQRVADRVDAAAVIAPGPREWPAISTEGYEYLHIWLEGYFLPARDTLVVAATGLGSGYWVMTPFQTRDRGTVLVNRGFVAQGVTLSSPPVGEVKVSGLLRMTEPGGSVLRDNQPGENRWYSRDVSAIAERQGLTSVAPYFLDAAKGQPGSPGGGGPTGGLTVIQFHNSHLVYVITWYGLALMVLGAAYLLWREERRR
jgi:surfeit locus 1 family protein